MGHLPLRDALDLLGLYAVGERGKYERAAIRWLARLALESGRITIVEFQLAASALQALPDRPETSIGVLRELCG